MVCVRNEISSLQNLRCVTNSFHHALSSLYTVDWPLRAHPQASGPLDSCAALVGPSPKNPRLDTRQPFLYKPPSALLE